MSGGFINEGEFYERLGELTAKPKFDKDAWILRAVAAKHLVVKPDGSIWRFSKIQERQRVYVRQKFSTHKKSGRVYFQLTFEDLTKSVLVNRVVALVLIPNPENLPEVNHKDGIKRHNEPGNLEWATRSDQERHAHREGLKSSRGSSNGNAKLTAAQVQQIRAAPEATLSEVAITLNISRKTINDVRARRTWSHV